MASTLFDSYRAGEYWRTNFAREAAFYSLFKEHLEQFMVGTDTNAQRFADDDYCGLDIGAGPGCAALLLNKLRVRTRLVGFEPSLLHHDGVALAKQLEEIESPVIYKPKNLGFLEAMESDLGVFDYILFMKSLHEIAGHYGDKTRFERRLMILLDEKLALNKKNGEHGLFIVGEPQYDQRITDDPGRYRALIDEVKEVDEERIGHCHEPGDYISLDELKEMLPDDEYEVKREDLIPHAPVDEALRARGVEFEFSPRQFYVVTFEKVDQG